MKKNRILPIISFLFLLGAISLSVYFKNIEKELETEQHKTQSESSIINQEN